MKKLFLLIFIFTIISLTSLGASSNGKKVLIVYYSRTGNTEVLAQEVAKLTNGTIFRVETINAYPDEYRQTTEQVKKELADGYLPTIKATLGDISSYDVIFVGYPIWWGTTPTPMKTLFKDTDFNGKVIIPFCTHGGGGVSRSVDDIVKEAPSANIVKNPFVTSNGFNSINSGELKKWIDSLGEYLK